MRQQKGKSQSNRPDPVNSINTGTSFDQRGQSLDSQVNIVTEQVVIQMPPAVVVPKSWHTVTSSTLRWISRFFTALLFVILSIWLISKLDFRPIKLGNLILDFSLIKPWLTSIGITFDTLYLLLSSIVSVMFALFTWRLSRNVAPSKKPLVQHGDQSKPQKLPINVNTRSFLLLNHEFLEERKVILKYVNRKLDSQKKLIYSIAIEMEEVPGAIESMNQSSWPTIEEVTRTADIAKIFDPHTTVQMLLGKPGSGKTTTLYKLCRHLCDQAGEDAAVKSIPILLSLASWATQRGKIDDWLIDSLSTRYGCKRRLAEPLLEDGSFIFLLDELDQVPAEYRTQCVDALNVFCKEPSHPVVICCRTQEYYQLPTKIAAVAAYQLLPLTPEQIDQYLHAVGPELTHLQTLIKSNSELNELARSPSMLNIMVLGSAIKIASPESDKLEPQQRIFDQYILSRIKPQKEDSPYPRIRVIRWLRWQAQRMFEFHINTFYLEDIQPLWLVPNNQQNLLLKIAFNSRFRKTVKTVLPYISQNPPGTKTVAPYTDISWQWRSAGIKLREGFVTGFNLGCWPVVFFGLFLGILVTLLGGAMTAQGRAADFNIIVKSIIDLVTNKDPLPWPFIPPIIGTVLGAMVGIPLGVLFSGPIVGIVNGLLGGVVSANTTKTTRPNQSLQRSGRSGLIAGISIGLITALGFGLIVGLLTNPSVGLITGICLGATVGTYAALTSGCTAFLVHYTLRYLLYLNNDIPFRYVRFLNYACDRAFLYRTGPGYIFSYHMLLEHFANLADKDIERISTELDR